jgi:hypothetical protein
MARALIYRRVGWREVARHVFKGPLTRGQMAEKYFLEIVLVLTVLSCVVVPDVLLPVQWAVTLAAVLYRDRLSRAYRDDTPEIKRFRDELKDLKAKVDAMIIGGRVRGG